MEDAALPGMKQVAVELFSGLAKSYDRTLDIATLLQDRYWKHWVVERTEGAKPGLMLDVGSGTLVLEERLFGSPWSIVGIDLTKNMVQMGKSKHLANVALLVNGDAETLPFRDGSFDAIASCYIAKYVFLPKYVRELSRVVKPGGSIVIYDFVKPRGPFAPLLALYIRGGLRALGFFLGLAKRDSAFTFQNLAGIVEGATWDRQVARMMEANGVRTEVFEHLSGGVVSAYWGIKHSEIGATSTT